MPIIIVCLAVTLIIVAIARYISQQEKSTESHYEILEENSSPKIGATVSNVFYNEIKTYCQRHHMTISDLIRKSVQNYMDENR